MLQAFPPGTMLPHPGILPQVHLGRLLQPCFSVMQEMLEGVTPLQATHRKENIYK